MDVFIRSIEITELNRQKLTTYVCTVPTAEYRTNTRHSAAPIPPATHSISNTLNGFVRTALLVSWDGQAMSAVAGTGCSNWLGSDWMIGRRCWDHWSERAMKMLRMMLTGTRMTTGNLSLEWVRPLNQRLSVFLIRFLLVLWALNGLNELRGISFRSSWWNEKSVRIDRYFDFF